MNIRMKKLLQYVLPTILGNCAYFLFTIIDGIFVGQGIGTDALGAINLVWPFVMVLNAFVMLTVVGGVTVSAVRIGRGDITGANQAFTCRDTDGRCRHDAGRHLPDIGDRDAARRERDVSPARMRLPVLVFAFRRAVRHDDVFE